MKALLIKIRQILRDRRTRQFLTRFVSVTAAIVVFVTTYALVLPAITMESQAACGIEAHQHDDSCYTEELICGQEESEGHHHTDSCYEKVLICGKEVHIHSEECYKSDEMEIQAQAVASTGITNVSVASESLSDEEYYSEDSQGEGASSGAWAEPDRNDSDDDTDYLQKDDEYIGENDLGLEADTGDSATSDSENIKAEGNSPEDVIADENSTEEVTADENSPEDVIADENNTEEVTVNENSPEDVIADENSTKEVIADENSTKEVTADENSTEEVTADENSTEDEEAEINEGKDYLDDISAQDDVNVDDGSAMVNADTNDYDAVDADTVDSEDKENSALEATSDVFPDSMETEELSDGYVPELDMLNVDAILTKKTGFYYYHAEEGDEMPESSALISPEDWKEYKEKGLFSKGTTLAPTDVIRAYFAYTIPAGSLNETNQAARYHLPVNLHLTDEQIQAINSTENGIAVGYLNSADNNPADSIFTDEINADNNDENSDHAEENSSRTAAEENEGQYEKYLGLEAIEGTRTPDTGLADGDVEYISAIVKAENVFDEETGEYLGQDLIFIFSPYTIEKNQIVYDRDGNPVSKGSKVSGWITLDFSMSQIDWVEEETDLDAATIEKKAEILFAAEDKENDVREISTLLHMTETNEGAGENSTEEKASEYATEDAAASTASTASESAKEETAAVAGTSNEASENAAAAGTSNGASEIAAAAGVTADGTSETAAAAGVTAEGASETAAEAATEGTAGTSTDMPEQTFEQTITVHTGSLASDTTAAGTEGTLPAETEMTVHVSAGAGTFPAGTTMTVTPVTGDGLDAVAAAVEGTIESRTRGFQAVDISFHDKDGKEIEPLKPIRVNMTSETIRQAVEDSSTAPVVVHVEDPVLTDAPAANTSAAEADTDAAPSASVIESVPVSAASDERINNSSDSSDKKSESSISNSSNNGGDGFEEAPRGQGESISADNSVDNSADTMDTLSFESDAFSVYAIVYTVDFHWEVNGRKIEFSIPGGGFVSFAKLMEVLGVTGREERDNSEDASESDISEEDTQKITALTMSSVEVSSEAKSFVADVEKVEFSNPDLVWIGKAADDCTVGELKEANKLKVDYSAELTEEQIAEINDQPVDSGDWALVSLKPFDTEESLYITMKNGDQFVIKVTDARIGNILDGQSFIIKTQDATPLAMTATDPYNYNNKRFFRAEEVTGKNEQIWILEYDGQYDRTYKIKSAATGQYITLDRYNDDGFILTDNANEATLFWIDYNSSTDTYEFSTNSPAHNYNITVYLDTLLDNNSPRFTMGTGRQRFKLQPAETQTDTAITGDWLLFLDEDDDEIYIRVGETITLRPFDEWTWKEGAIQNDHWYFPDDTNAPANTSNNWYIANNAGNESSQSNWTSSNGVFKFYRHIKYDDQLGVRYWSAQGQALKVGDYKLANTRNDHEIIVHVIPADDEYHKLTPVTGPVPVKVNLFDYDKEKRLDPTNNSNTETGIVNQSVNINHYLHFLSSGNNNGGINRYTKDNNNPKIVADTLDANGYPVLRDYNQSLGYLFDKTKTSWTGGNYNDGMIAYPDVTGLFQQDQDGYYYFNSNSNYAYYDSNTNSMLLYPHTYTQVRKGGLFNSKPIGFFPFHEYESKDPDHLWVNQNQYLNHHIGMSMEIDFEIPKSRETVSGKDIVYEFSGDDDVWVFVDGKLALDIGGIHQPLGGKIDFTNGKAYVYNASGTVTETYSWDVGAHKLSMFYLERGGCDSNLSLKMNMPLILGPGDVELFKSGGTGHTGLQDAVFGIWENAACDGEPYMVAVSDENGLVVKKNLPVRVEGQEFYIREILAPQGYTLDDTIYKATAGTYNAATGRYPFTITALTAEGETEPATYTVGGKTLPEVVNTPAAPIDLSVQKVWQNADGSDGTAPPGASLKFLLKRTRTYLDAPSYTVRLRNQSRDYDIYDTISAHEGDELTISYTHNADSGHPVANCTAGNGAGTILSMTTNDTTTESRVTYTVNPAHASGNVIDIMIPDWFAEWCDPGRHSGSSGQLRVPKFAGVNKADVEITTEDDDDFNDEQHSITLPTTQGAWTDAFSNLPVQEEVGGTLYQYRYFIVEDTAASNIPDGYETIYTDYTGTHPINGQHSQETATSGTQKIINQKLLDIPVTKIWPDYEKEHAGKTYTWEVDLHLDYRDVPTDGQGQPTRWQEYQPDNEDYQKKLTKENHESSFEDLPMYVYDDNGRQFRREYSVVEKGYKVWENGILIASHIGNTYTPSDNRYALWYEHDAGEDSTDPNSYYISVFNMHENRDIKEDITIDINKVWKNADGTTIQPGDEYKAKFKLKRNVLVEYRNHEDEDLPKTEWVVVNLVTDSNPDHIKTLVVPPGTPMFIRGNLKAGASPSTITFTRSDTGEQLTAVADDEFSEQGYNLFMVEFNAPTTQRAVVTVNMDEFSDANVVGGSKGFILSDSDDRQYFGADDTFLKEFELSNQKGWSKHFPDTTGSGSGVDDLLPVVEVSELDTEGKTANTYIYTYYFEEVEGECVPADFYASFTDSTGHAFGDADHQIYTDSTVTAVNRVKPGSIRIKKNVTVNGEEVNASDPNTQFVDGTYSFRIEGIPDTDTADVQPRTVTITISDGQSDTIEVKDLAPGQYKVTELTSPNGTSLVGQNGIIVEVVENVTGTDAPLVEMTNNRELIEVKVNKEWAATSPADHPTDVTFKLYRIGYYMDGESQSPASEGYYPDSNTTFTVHGSEETTVSNLPLHGVESIAGINRFVTYEYRVVEMPVAGDTAYWPSYSTEGTETTITNTPIEKPTHVTDVSVSKSWLDKDGHDASADHEDDEIEFTLKETPHNTGYVPVHLVYINADNTSWKQQEVFVKKNERLNFVFRKGSTLFNHLIEITEGNNHTTTGGRVAQYGYESNAITDETTITLRQTFTYNGLLNTYYDMWGDTVEDLGFSYQWTSTVTATGGTLYTDYSTFYSAMKTVQGGEANELLYTLSKDEITGEENTYEGQITGDWAAIFEDLPQFQKVGDDYVVMTYEISELKIKPAGEDEEPVGSTTAQGYLGETTNYLVNWVQNGDSWTITNSEKPGLDVIIRKTDTTGSPLAGAVFEISKQKGSVFFKLTHDKYDWLDENDQFTVPEEGIMLTGLKDGVYQIKEAIPPDGYVLEVSIPVEFEIMHGAVVAGSNVLSEGVTHVPASGSDKDAYVIPNTPGAALPNAGGSGTRLFTILGSILLTFALSGILLIRRQRTIY